MCTQLLYLLTRSGTSEVDFVCTQTPNTATISTQRSLSWPPRSSRNLNFRQTKPAPLPADRLPHYLQDSQCLPPYHSDTGTPPIPLTASNLRGLTPRRVPLHDRYQPLPSRPGRAQDPQAHEEEPLALISGLCARKGRNRLPRPAGAVLVLQKRNEKAF